MSDAHREFLLDVSRPVWRAWRGRLPTGIDRVCLAYVERFGARSQAVIQRRGFHLVLSPSHSDRLFELLCGERLPRRLALLRLAATALAASLPARPSPGAIYLNVGHTGLNEPSLPAWLARHRLRAVYLVHDLIPLTHPQFCRPGEAEKHSRRMENVLASAAGLISNSQATLDELADFAQEKQLAMPPAVVAWISGGKIPSTVPSKTTDKTYFVTVGTIEGRKNHQLLLDVWRSLVASLGSDTPTLVIIGQRGWQAERIFRQLDRLDELEGHVQELGACSDAELAGWVAGARAMLMPSFTEGYGLPVIEALQLGTPVIASSLPVFREIAGDIPTYLDPLNAPAWERTIRAFAGEGNERARQLSRMDAYRAPDWNTHFGRVEQWLKSL